MRLFILLKKIKKSIDIVFRNGIIKLKKEGKRKMRELEELINGLEIDGAHYDEFDYCNDVYDVKEVLDRLNRSREFHYLNEHGQSTDDWKEASIVRGGIEENEMVVEGRYTIEVGNVGHHEVLEVYIEITMERYMAEDDEWSIISWVEKGWD